MSDTDIIRLAAETAAKTAIQEYKKEVEKAAKESKNRKLRNTKLLLRNYRALKAHAQNAVFDKATADENVVDILALMQGKEDAGTVVESIMRSATRTCLILSHIDVMLAAYQKMCSRRPIDQRRWNVIYAKYIAEEPLTDEQIAEKEFINPRTVHKDIDYACSRLSALIFGIDAMR